VGRPIIALRIRSRGSLLVCTLLTALGACVAPPATGGEIRLVDDAGDSVFVPKSMSEADARITLVSGFFGSRLPRIRRVLGRARTGCERRQHRFPIRHCHAVSPTRAASLTRPRLTSDGHVMRRATIFQSSSLVRRMPAGKRVSRPRPGRGPGRRARR
jgi:hypothetical protein